MAKGKFKYQSYDYSFLEPKDSWYLSAAKRICAKTIGYDITTTQTMNEPSGQLYWVAPTFTTATTINDNITQRITEVSNEIERRSSRGRANYMVTGGCASSIMGELNRKRMLEKISNRTTDYFRKVDFYKRLKHIKYGKKI